MPDVLDIAGSLRGKRIFITGATGFVGKVLVEKLLWSLPEVGKLLLLVRPTGERTAAERLAGEILGSPIMARLRAHHGDRWPAWVASKVEVVAGDLRHDRFGLDEEPYTALCRRVDRVVASAATVSFEERLDHAVELNARAALRPLTLARDAGDVPLVHVSTCYVSGRRQGSIAERLVEPEPGEDGPFDLAATLRALDDACRRLRAYPGGTPYTPPLANDAAFVEAGRTQAGRHGFNDVYTLTKALGERLVARDRGSVPVAIVRPAIVESAAEQPIPGWIEAIRVSDPLLVAYGRGRTRDIPGTADVPLELIPVDTVVNALLAALADLRRGEPSAEIPVYQIGSSRHPITLGELMAHAREGFVRTPLRDDQGAPITLREARFVEPERLRRRLDAKRGRVRTLARALAGVGSSRFTPRLGVAERTLEHFSRLIEVYRPYLSHGASYQDEATRGLWNRLSARDQATFPFDITAIDWRAYIARVHLPGLVRFALKAESGAPPAAEPQEVISRRLAEAETHAARATTLFTLFASVARANPDTLAFQTCRDGQWLRYTYDQALTTAANVAWRLATVHGIERGDRVALWASGSPEWVIATFAVHRLGATTVPLDPQWPAEEIAQAARLVGAKLIAAKPALVATMTSDPGCPVVALAAPLVPEPDVGLLAGAEKMGPLDQAVAPCTAEDVASILFTSGTTVAPKAVPLTHANYLANVRDLVPLMRLSHDRLLSVLPIHHVFEQMVGLLVPMAGASTISYVAEIKPAEINWMMGTTRPTVLAAVPRLLELLHGGIFQSVKAGGPMLAAVFKVLFALSKLTGARYGHRLFGKVHRRFGGSLRRIATGGAALEPTLGRSFQLMGFAVAEGYGMTETSPVLTVNPWAEIRFGSAGRALPGVQIDLRSPADAIAVEPGSGEIWVRGDNVMAGYYQNPEATDQVLRDGWLNTGDIGYFDNGYLYLSGRSKDVIVSGAGKNVYPEEVELRYRDIAHVQELIVLGLPASGGGRGERVTALVVPRPGASDEEVERIRSTIAERSGEIPSYQRVSRVEIWRGDLPKTTTLKVKRGLLREAVLAGERGAGDQPPPTAAVEAPRGEAEAWVIDTLARLTRTRADQLHAEDRLTDLGVDSLTHVELVGAFEAHFGKHLDDDAVAGLARVQDLFDLV